MKFLFPVAWIGMFGSGTLGLWLGGFNQANSAPPNEMKWQFLFIWIIGSLFIWAICIRNKRVEIDDLNLYISNYFREISVPLSQIENVSEYVWVNPRLVVIRLREDTCFGKSIQFIPKTLFFTFWKQHPVVSELLVSSRTAATNKS
jgi:hypothetical protein